MALAGIFKAAAKIGFGIASDAKGPITVYAEPVLSGAYDIATDRTVPVWGKTKTCLALIGDAAETKSQKTQGTKPERKYRAVYVEGVELEGFNLESEMELDAEGFRWKVEEVETDPVRALITFTLYR